MKKIIITMFAAFSLSIFAPLFVQPAYAACARDDSPKGQVIKGIGETGSDCSEDGVTNFISAIITIISFIAGIAGVIMVIISGFRYITSGGDSGKVATAKNTLIYALVGLAVAALAQFLVHFTITAATSDPPKSCPTGKHRSKDGKECVSD